MSSREAILQRIRTELAKGPVIEAPPVPEVWLQSGATPNELADRFCESLQAVHGEVLRFDTTETARHGLATLLEESGWQTIGSADRAICRELTAQLGAERVAEVDEGWSAEQIAELPVSLVAAEHLLADTGTCMVICGTAQDRLMCYLPPACVVVGRVEQLAEHMPAAWRQIAPRAAEPDRRGEFVLITGPSRTADIEKILILGVHGPKRLVVLLVG